MAPLPISELADADAEVAARGRSWAHVSGWAQLSGSRHTVSCIVPCQNQARILSGLLPALSDALTECGYPWEIIVVDRGSTDPTPRDLALWSELPGYRCLRCSGNAQTSLAVATGLCDARGDAVIIVDPTVAQVTALVPNMIARWEAGAILVCAAPDGANGAMHVLAWDDANLQRRATPDSPNLPAETTRFSLLDRRLVDQLIQR